MKFLVATLLYILLTMIYFFAVSVFGLPFADWNYLTVITNKDWFFIYMLFIHWWLVIPSLIPYNETHLEDYFN